MTYCLGILLPAGLVLASDSRSSAGVDQIALVNKLSLFSIPGSRVVTLLAAGNLATTQAVVAALRQTAGSRLPDQDIHTAQTLFDVAVLVGRTLRDVIARDGDYVQSYGDPSASFLVGGQIEGEPPRLFQIYSAGNFVEASDRSRFLQIGETKYGKPILDRGLSAESNLDEGAKLALLSFDATIRSNLSVEAPIDLLRYATDSFSDANLVTFDKQDAYWTDLRQRYSDGLAALVDKLPSPPRRVDGARLYRAPKLQRS
ncbi:MAG TPA: peptidase [Stellaceae bacterium]|nr:peptidase [Stellaceae bacterium]